MNLNKYLKKITPITTILLASFAIICSGIGSFYFEKSFAHNFSPNEILIF